MVQIRWIVPTPAARTRRHLRYLGIGADLDAHRVKQAMGCLGNAFRQAAQDARRRLDQNDVDVACGSMRSRP